MKERKLNSRLRGPSQKVYRLKAIKIRKSGRPKGYKVIPGIN